MSIGKKIFCGLLAVTLAGLSACSADEPPRIPVFEYAEQSGDVNEEKSALSERSYDYFGKIGSAGELKGTTLLISIFASDAKTSWDFDSKEDYSTYCWAYSDIGIAAEWITESAAPYSNASFVWDWVENPDLVYFTETEYDVPAVFETGTNTDLVNTYECFWEYIDTHIPTEKLMKKYGADNVVYLALFDSPAEQTRTSCTRNWADASWMSYPYEVSYFFMHSCGSLTAPASFAHEILHCFGAPDLYLHREYGITEEYVQWAMEQKTNDIMRVTFDNMDGHTRYYDHISNELTDITLYYLGLTDYSETVEKWGFEKNQHSG